MPRFNPAWESALALLSRAGLGLVGVADVAAYDAVARPELRGEQLLPGARRVVVVGSGGPALWQAMVDALRADPSRLAETPHPLDAFVGLRVAEADALLPSVPRRWFFASATAEVHLDFRTLALVAGLGTHSRLGLLINPVHGPWIGLRAACFVDDDGLEPDRPLVGSPCDDCAAPCTSACPGGAFPEGRWDVGTCAAFHRTSTRCAQSCDARSACPVGAGSRYPPDELRYHYDRRTGRAALRAEIGLDPAADPHEGVGPHWQAW